MPGPLVETGVVFCVEFLQVLFIADLDVGLLLENIYSNLIDLGVGVLSGNKKYLNISGGHNIHFPKLSQVIINLQSGEVIPQWSTNKVSTCFFTCRVSA